MALPVTIGLGHDVGAVLGEKERARGIGLSMFPRQWAREAAHRLRREQIRRQSKGCLRPDCDARVLVLVAATALSGSSGKWGYTGPSLAGGGHATVTAA